MSPGFGRSSRMCRGGGGGGGGGDSHNLPSTIDSVVIYSFLSEWILTCFPLTLLGGSRID